MNLWNTIKGYALAILGVATGVLAVIAKRSSDKAKREELRADTADAKHEHAVDVLENDIEVDKELAKKKGELKDEVKKTGTSSELSNPNDW